MQRLHARIVDEAILEWLPPETIGTMLAIPANTMRWISRDEAARHAHGPNQVLGEREPQRIPRELAGLTAHNAPCGHESTTRIGALAGRRSRLES